MIVILIPDPGNYLLKKMDTFTNDNWRKMCHTII